MNMNVSDGGIMISGINRRAARPNAYMNTIPTPSLPSTPEVSVLLVEPVMAMEPFPPVEFDEHIIVEVSEVETASVTKNVLKEDDLVHPLAWLYDLIVQWFTKPKPVVSSYSLNGKLNIIRV